jgi:hypothetical protein
VPSSLSAKEGLHDCSTTLLEGAQLNDLDQRMLHKQSDRGHLSLR